MGDLLGTVIGGALGGIFGGGDDNQPQQTVNNVYTPPDYLRSANNPFGYGLEDYINRGGQIAQNYATNPHVIYGNDGQPMVAQMSDLQNIASNGYNAQASAIPWRQQQATNLNANDLLNGYMFNGGVNRAATLGNPYLGATNPYAGDNPYLQGMLNASNQDITNNYLRGAAANTAAAAAQSGAFGGSKYDEQVQANQKTLADSLAQNEANVRGQNYYNSANLASQDLLRNSGLAESGLNRATGAQESALARGLQALGMNNQTNFEQLGALQGLMGAGNLQQQTQQNNINAAQNLFNQNVQLPMQMEQFYGDILQQAGGMGRPTSQTMSVPGQSPFMNAVGGALIGNQLIGNGSNGILNLGNLGNLFGLLPGFSGSGGAAP